MNYMEGQRYMEHPMDELLGEPFKILDYSGKKRVGVVAKSLYELMTKAKMKLNIPSDVPIRVALEKDGTEIEDEEYFCTLEKNTVLVVLVGDQKWLPYTKISKYRYAFDEFDGEERPSREYLNKLVDQLYYDLSNLTLLGTKDLELLAEMDPSVVASFFPADSRVFFDSLKEASIRFLNEKTQAKEAMELLRMYHSRHGSSDQNQKQKQKQKPKQKPKPKPK